MSTRQAFWRGVAVAIIWAFLVFGCSWLGACVGPGKAPITYQRQPFPWEVANYAREAGITNNAP